MWPYSQSGVPTSYMTNLSILRFEGNGFDRVASDLGAQVRRRGDSGNRFGWGCTVPAHFADDEIDILNNVRTIMYSRLTRISKTICFAQWLKALLHGPHMSKAVDHTSSRTWNWTTLYLMCTSSVTQPNRKSGYPYNVHVMHIFAIVLNRNYRNSWELRRSAS